MLLRLHFFPGLTLLLLALGLQFQIVRWLSERFPARRRPLRIATVPSSVLLFLGYALEFQRVLHYFPPLWATWIECTALVETFWLVGTFAGLLLWRNIPGQRGGGLEFHPTRRKFLEATAVGLGIAPLAVTAFGILERNRFLLTEIDIPIPNLPQDLHGLRIVQVTDIHLSAFLSEREFARGIDMANETRAHLALVSGDLISRPGDPLDACLRQLARLRADAGALGCLGNHEVYTGTEDYVTEQGRLIGIEFLRDQARLLRFGSATINFAGVDYQRMNSDYLQGTEHLIVPGTLNVMLSHNPDVFPAAAAKGYDLTIAGHTHGGQVDVEILHQHINVARYFTPYVRGLYRKGNTSAYVSAGLGTIGVPVRVGAPPEISLLRLCAI